MVDIRTIGLVGAIDLAPNAVGPGKRGFEAMDEAYHRQDLLFRIAGDTLVLSPPLIISDAQIGEVADRVGKVIKALG